MQIYRQLVWHANVNANSQAFRQQVIYENASYFAILPIWHLSSVDNKVILNCFSYNAKSLVKIYLQLQNQFLFSLGDNKDLK